MILEIRREVQTGDRDSQDFRVMGLDDITQGVSLAEAEKSVILKKIILGQFSSVAICKI